MAPRRATPEASASDSDSDAPEAVTLSQSKKHSKRQDAVIQHAHAAQKEKRRLLNQERDKRLKEQAEHSKKKRKARATEEAEELQARMERAMQEAANESGADEDTDGGAQSVDEAFTGIDGALSGESDEEAWEMDEEGGSDEDEDGEVSEDEADDTMDAEPTSSLPSAQSPRNPKHLPDHLFTSAFSAQAQKTKPQSKTSTKKLKSVDEPSTHSRKRPRSNGKPKDVLIGSRAIRTLSQDQHPSGSGTLPSAKVKRFINRTLALKGDNPRTRGWERRPVNIGVMRRDGPAASFVRKR